ncbi:unnamed protein product [Gongylonema pulchrum]|uniref:Uncharacterized protein n=1 Tax=Gongylonema pulchrum TaxID=637853 RepID=A0A183E1E6_9BILA|nr:unnamed protein product [Gongylonema pulchrum]
MNIRNTDAIQENELKQAEDEELSLEKSCTAQFQALDATTLGRLASIRQIVGNECFQKALCRWVLETKKSMNIRNTDAIQENELKQAEDEEISLEKCAVAQFQALDATTLGRLASIRQIVGNECFQKALCRWVLVSSGIIFLLFFLFKLFFLFFLIIFLFRNYFNTKAICVQTRKNPLQRFKNSVQVRSCPSSTSFCLSQKSSFFFKFLGFFVSKLFKMVFIFFLSN